MAWARAAPAISAGPIRPPTPRTTPTRAPACRRLRSRCRANLRSWRHCIRRRATHCTSWRAAMAATSSPVRWRSTTATSIAISGSTADDHATREIHQPGGRRGRRQEHLACRLARRSGRPRHQRGADPRTRWHSHRRGDTGDRAGPGDARVGRGDRVAADVRLTRPTGARSDRPRPGRGPVGVVRPLHRCQLRLPGWWPWPAEVAHRGVGALGLRWREARPDPAARPAGGGRSRPRCRSRRSRPDRVRGGCVFRAGTRQLSRARSTRARPFPRDRCQPAARRGTAGRNPGVDGMACGVADLNAPPWHVEHWARLQSRLRRDALPHALLLCGAVGLGKRAFARGFVQGLLCTGATDGDACGCCRSCRLMDAGSHPDVVALTFGLRKDGTPRTEIVVEQIRDLSARLAMRSQLGGWQVATIDPADAMNAAAANALLKTLEEPAAQTMLILLADAPWRLPQTIRSRCQRIEFQLPASADALAWLQGEGVRDAANALAAAGGNPGLASIWAAEGALERRQEVRKDLAALAAGRGQPTEVVKRWLDSEPAQRLWFAAQAAADEIKARSAHCAGPLSSAQDVEALGHWYDAANRTRERLRGPLRADRLLLELLAQWRCA